MTLREIHVQRYSTVSQRGGGKKGIKYTTKRQLALVQILNSYLQQL